MDPKGMALREVTEKFKDYGVHRNSAVQRCGLLLRLLSEGKLTARFDFPSIERPQIIVPAAYWKEVKAGEFRKALDGNRANKGDYVVAPRKFAEQYLDWFLGKHELTKSSSELTAALRASGTRVDVYVLEKDWETFVTEGGLDTREHSTKDGKSSRGKGENPNWSAILVEVAVELLKAPSDQRPVTKMIARNALSWVTPRDKTKLPDTDTVGKKVDEIINRVW